MKVRRVYRKRVDHQGDGSNVVADVNAVVAASVGEEAAASSVSNSSQVRIVQ